MILALSTGIRFLPAPADPTAARTPPAGPSAGAGDSLPEKVSFNEHVASILYRRCASCHRPGEAGPFPLLSYQDAAPRAAVIAYVTAKRIMPPWPADFSYRHFATESVLSDREIGLLQRWAATGAPEGDPKRRPPAPVFPRGSQLGKPDLVVRMPHPYRIRGDNTDHFVIVKAPFQIPRDTLIRAIEFVPGNRQLVHHMNASLITYPDGAKRDVFAGDWYAEGGEHSQHTIAGLNLPNDDGSLAPITFSVSNYLPGGNPLLYPEGIGGYRVTTRGLLLMNVIHYGPSARDTTDQSYFNLFFAKKPPDRPTFEVILGTMGAVPVLPDLIIPPNTVKTVHSEYTLPADISVLTINPHMHLLGRSFLAYAVTPDRDTIPLIRIPHWDFRWQLFYTYPRMLPLRKGTTIHAEGVYDNTVNNSHNPFHPPREVRDHNGSMRTSDEMFQCILTFVAYQPGDERISLEARIPARAPAEQARRRR